MSKLFWSALGLALAIMAGPASADAGRMSCTALKDVALPHATVTSAEAITPPFSPAGASTIFGTPTVTVPFCRVIGVSRPTADSQIGFELWIPEGAAWNGRYLQIGNGGFAGSIGYASMVRGVMGGYATAGTDDGHQSAIGTDAAWAMGHPEKVVDFGYRALKETTDAAKALLTAYEGKPPRYSYFNGCSDGGREALMEAQRYPADFDGIVAGDPANDWVRLLSASGWNYQALNKNPASFIPAAKLKALDAASRAQCGDAEGVIENPLVCRFDPSKLLCAGAETDECLTAPQVDALKRIYFGAHNPRTGERIMWGFDPGGESGPLGWRPWIIGGAPGPAGHALQYEFGRNFFQYVVKADSKFDLLDLNFDTDVADARARFEKTFSSLDPDLSAFKRRGGKLIQYHGWADPAIPPRSSIAYYDTVQGKMGSTADFYRLFMVPGMLHCAAGPGPNQFDHQGVISAWVEKGEAPDRILATKRAGDSPSGAVQFSRPLCPHPAVAVWDGKGDRAKAESWVCRRT